MRYVSKIVNSKGVSVTSLVHFLGHKNEHNYTIYVSDTDSCSVEVADNNVPCLGFVIDEANTRKLIVCHTKKTATLHRYVNMTEAVVGIPPFKYKKADLFSMKSRQAYVEPGNSVLDISISDDMICVYDSVAVWTGADGDIIAIEPLYDTLIRLCRRTGLNLMSYETIQIGNSSVPCRTTVRLLHTSEADVFYMKMLLEANGGCVGSEGDFVELRSF